MSKNHYVYLTTNLINGKQYIGDHSIAINERYYIGSGLAFKSATKKYKEENFFKEILEWYSTKKEAFDAQEKYIKKYNTLVPNGYNISPTGGNRVRGCHSEETKQKIKQANTGKKRTKETKLKLSLNRKNKTYNEIYGEIKGNEIREQHSEWLKKYSPLKGKRISEKHKKILSESNKGKTLSKEHQEKLNKSHTGKTQSIEHVAKRMKAHIGAKRSEETKAKISKSNKGRTAWNKGISKKLLLSEPANNILYLTV
jgi:hypothetical protein